MLIAGILCYVKSLLTQQGWLTARPVCLSDLLVTGVQERANAAAVLATDLHDFLGGSHAQIREAQGRESAVFQQARPRVCLRVSSQSCNTR